MERGRVSEFLWLTAGVIYLHRANNGNARTTANFRTIGVFVVNFEQISQMAHCSAVWIVDFEQVNNAGWEYSNLFQYLAAICTKWYRAQ